MKRRNLLCMIAAASLLCWGGVISCSNDDDNSSGGGNGNVDNAVHDDVWKINYGDKAFVGTSEGATANKTHASYPGYDGSYIDGLGGGYVDYAINSAEEQNVTILLHYAYWGTKEALRGAQIVVNGKRNEDIIYCNWTSKSGDNIWQDSNEITVHLNAGNNALRVVPVPAGTEMDDKLAKYPEGVAETDKTWKAEGNLPNIDYLQITGKGLSAGNATATAYYRVKASGDFGTVTLEPEQDYYAKDTKVKLKANPKAGYKFDAWWGTRAYDEEEWEITVTEELNLTAHFIPNNYSNDGLYGYGAITDDAGTKYTITGGANGETIRIGNHSDLTTNAEKLSSDIPYIVLFTNGTRITTNDNKSEYYTVGSNKTIYGTVKGAGLKNIELRISGDNVIVRNMVFGEVIGDDTFSGTGNDALSINGAKHVWIDHCELFSNLEPKNNDGTAANTNDEKDWYDGLLDVKNGATWITVSNCYLHDHWKAVLCGSGDDHDDGDSAMRITFVGNYFENINSRQPLFRWGKAHIYNNYYKGASDKQANCIDVRIDSQVLAEGNYFESVKNAIGIDLANGNSSTMGKAEYNFPNSNKLDSCTNTPSKGSSSYVPKYEYNLKTAVEAKTAAEKLKESVFLEGLK